MNPNRLGAKTTAVLAYVREEVAAGRPFPSEEQIQRAIGYGYKSQVNEALVRLSFHGLVVRLGREPSGRGFRITWGLPTGPPEPYRTRTYRVDEVPVTPRRPR